MVRTHHFWRTAGYALALTACAPTTRESDLAFDSGRPTEEARLVVHNDYLGEIDIYTVTAGSRARIGSVQPGRTRDFVISRSLLARPEIQFQVDPVGPASPFTYQPISVSPGNVVALSIAPELRMSTYSMILDE